MSRVREVKEEGPRKRPRQGEHKVSLLDESSCAHCGHTFLGKGYVVAREFIEHTYCTAMCAQFHTDFLAGMIYHANDMKRRVISDYYPK